MLSKLLKYEFKATAKLILLSWAALLVVSVLNYIVMPWTDTGSTINEALVLGNTGDVAKSVTETILFIVYILIAVAVVIMAYVLMLIRFYKMLGDEGYLMFTLPVSATKHILGKLITSVIWTLCSFILVGFSILIVIGRHDVFKFIANFWREAASRGYNPSVWAICIFIFFLLVITSSILMFYTAMSIGPHITRSRIGGSILGYIIVYIAYQVIGGIGMAVMMLTISGNSVIIDGSVPMQESVHSINSLGLSYFIVIVCIVLATAIPCYCITRYMLTKKLNLG